MQSTALSFDLSSAEIESAASDIRDYLRDDRGIEASPDEIRRGMADVLKRRFEMFSDELVEIFTTPSREEAQELETAILHTPKIATPAPDVTYAPVFSGERTFSAKRLESMITYLVERGRYIYKTNLNKLLFYADLSAFYLRGQGMSGAVYLNRPFGPVADPTAALLDDMLSDGRLVSGERTKDLLPANGGDVDLSDDDKKILDWVLMTYGQMGAREISDYSHAEKAYANTRPNEPIAYAYAKFFKKLPPKDLLKQN